MRVTAFYQDVTRVKSDMFVAGITGDIRPPAGLVGKVDWYLDGFISRQIIEGTLGGGAGEMTLVAVQRKLLTPRLLLVGMGDSRDLDRDVVAGCFSSIGGAVKGLGLKSIALEVPPMETPRTGAPIIMRETLRGFRESFVDQDMPIHCEVQVLARTEEESEGWRRVIRAVRF